MNKLSLIENLLKKIEENLFDKFDYCSYICKMGEDEREIKALFKDVTGFYLNEYIKNRILSESYFKLIEGKDSILDIGLECGYSSEASYSRSFKKLFNKTPGQIKKYKEEINLFNPILFDLNIYGGFSSKSEPFLIEKKVYYGIKKEFDLSNLYTSLDNFFSTFMNDIFDYDDKDKNKFKQGIIDNRISSYILIKINREAKIVTVYLLTTSNNIKYNFLEEIHLPDSKWCDVCFGYERPRDINEWDNLCARFLKSLEGKYNNNLILIKTHYLNFRYKNTFKQSSICVQYID